MSTTLKLPPELKRRIAKIVEVTGQSPHAFMVDAIRLRAEQAEKRSAMVDAARQARNEVERTGRVYDWDEVREHYRAKLQGKRTTKPKAKSWRG
jgi:predicted transcriptional regulator